MKHPHFLQAAPLHGASEGRVLCVLWPEEYSINSPLLVIHSLITKLGNVEELTRDNRTINTSQATVAKI